MTWNFFPLIEETLPQVYGWTHAVFPLVIFADKTLNLCERAWYLSINRT